MTHPESFRILFSGVFIDSSSLLGLLIVNENTLRKDPWESKEH